MHLTRHRLVGMSAACVIAMAGCGGDDDDDTGGDGTTAATEAAGATPASAADTSAASGGSLADACPNPIVIQTDWYPQAEHGGTYQLVVGENAEIDASRGAVRGPLYDTGVDIEIRVAGSFIGDNSVQATMYQDDEILLGYVNTDAAIKFSETLPVVGVFQGLDISPEILMYDPEDATYESFADIASNPDARILYYEGSPSVDYLIGQGFVTPEQLDPSYDGGPSRFVTEDNILQQGFVSAEVFKYEEELEEWGKPVDYLLFHDAGYTNYVQTLSVRPDDVAAQAPCLEQFVPIMQQAQIDYANDPAATNAFMVEYNGQLNSSWTITDGLVESGAAIMAEVGILGNGPDDTLGNFDVERVDQFIVDAVPLFEAAGVDTITAGLAAEDIVTNEFIDEELGL